MRMGRVRPELIAALSQVPEVKKQVRRVGAQIRDEARRNAPVRTGRLRKSIKVDNVLDRQTGQVVHRVGWDKEIAWYGPLVETGTENAPAQPHLRPAADRFGGRPPRSE